jgi:hypothetical protein
MAIHSTHLETLEANRVISTKSLLFALSVGLLFSRSVKAAWRTRSSFEPRVGFAGAFRRCETDWKAPAGARGFFCSLAPEVLKPIRRTVL